MGAQDFVHFDPHLALSTWWPWSAMSTSAVKLFFVHAVAAAAVTCPQTWNEAASLSDAPGKLGVVGGSFVSQEEIEKSFPWIVSLSVHQDEMGGNTCGGAL